MRAILCAYPNAYAYPMHGEMYPDAQTSPYPRSAPIRTSRQTLPRDARTNREGRTIWIVDAHGYGKRFVVRTMKS